MKSSIAVASFALFLAVGMSCSKPTSHRPPTLDAGSFDKNAVLSAIGTCALATYRDFDSNAQKLVDATASAATDAAAIKARRDAWNGAMDAWQEAEVMQIGPIAPTTIKGGEGLRNDFYGWPSLSRCEVDKVLVAKTYETADFSKTSFFNVRGLGALEYLLFYEGADNGCVSTDAINASGSWAALSKDEIAARRAAYAKVLAADLHARSQQLVEKWDPAKGNFLATFANAGKGSAVYKTVEEGFDVANDALFYLEFVTKDDKLGAPIGVDEAKCSEPPCGELLESRIAIRAKQHVRTNLVAFRKLFTGCAAADFSGIAFDDLLDAVGAGALADQMDADIVDALAVVDAFPYASFEEAFAKGDVEAVRKVYVAVKKLTDALKSEFVSVLHLSLPARVAGDND